MQPTTTWYNPLKPSNIQKNPVILGKTYGNSLVASQMLPAASGRLLKLTWMAVPLLMLSVLHRQARTFFFIAFFFICSVDETTLFRTWKRPQQSNGDDWLLYSCKWEKESKEMRRRGHLYTNGGRRWMERPIEKWTKTWISKKTHKKKEKKRLGDPPNKELDWKNANATWCDPSMTPVRINRCRSLWGRVSARPRKKHPLK